MSADKYILAYLGSAVWKLMLPGSSADTAATAAKATTTTTNRFISPLWMFP